MDKAVAIPERRSFERRLQADICFIERNGAVGREKKMREETLRHIRRTIH